MKCKHDLVNVNILQLVPLVASNESRTLSYLASDADEEQVGLSNAADPLVLRSEVGNLRSLSPSPREALSGLTQGDMTPDRNTMPTPTSLSRVCMDVVLNFSVLMRHTLGSCPSRSHNVYI